MDAYRGAWWLPDGHAQTIYPYLFLRPAPLQYRRERIETPDGDFVDFDWLDGEGPVVVLFHGLEGSSRSHYATAILGAAAARGWRGVVPHWRGCSGEPNRLPRAYHSGDHAEAAWMMESVGPTAWMCPLCSQMTRVQNSCKKPRSCPTMTTMRALWSRSRMRASAFLRKTRSPVAKTSSIKRISGQQEVAMANASRISMPVE